MLPFITRLLQIGFQIQLLPYSPATEHAERLTAKRRVHQKDDCRDGDDKLVLGRLHLFIFSLFEKRRPLEPSENKPKGKADKSCQNGNQGVHHLLTVEQRGSRLVGTDAVHVDNVVAECRNGALELKEHNQRPWPSQRERPGQSCQQFKN